MKALAWASLPPVRVMAPQRARKFQRAPPEVLGLAVTTSTALLSRSFQVLIFLGLPGRTKAATVELTGTALFGASFSQPGLIRPAFSILARSAAMARLTTSASKPSISGRVWEPEPP
jgi:hypothetical protein